MIDKIINHFEYRLMKSKAELAYIRRFGSKKTPRDNEVRQAMIKRLRAQINEYELYIEYLINIRGK